MKYDDASWHCGANSFPKNSPEEYGCVHIGLFLRWCFVRGWAGAVHLKEEPAETQAVIDGALSGTAFLNRFCDGKLTDMSLNAEGNAFAAQYYGPRGHYLNDYQRLFPALEYRAPEAEHDFAAFSAALDARLASGVLVEPVRPWWKFW